MQRRKHDFPTLAILAGGEGSRMGMPKAHLRVGDKPILQALLRWIDWPGPTLLVTAPNRQRPPGAECFDAEAIDPVSGQGPLRGVLTAIEHCPTELLVIATVDMPGIRQEHLRQLLDRLQPDRLGVMFQRGERIEPFPFACRKTAKAAVAERLAGDDASVHGLISAEGFASTPAPRDWPPSVWTNLNRVQEYEAFIATLKMMSTETTEGTESTEKIDL